MISSAQHRKSIIVLLGLLTALHPSSIDMYLPAFPAMARDLHATMSDMALSLASYFVGIALGQLCYGPLLDRFGRKKPLAVGLVIYAMASVGCMLSHNLNEIVFWRFVVGMGGCVAYVAAYAMVRDLFLPEERANIFALIMLVMGVSPLLAPSIGSVVTLFIGWQAIFAILITIALLLIIGSWCFLPETHLADETVRLNPWRIAADYFTVVRTPAFYIYGLCGAVSFMALYVFLSGSPILFFNFFHVSTTTYGWIFTIIVAGFISASQLNIFLLRYFKNIQILKGALLCQGVIALFFCAMSWSGSLSLVMAVTFLFFLLACVGVAFPNAATLAMIPFGHNTGRASAFISFSQMFCGIVVTIIISSFSGTSMRPIGLITAVTSCLAVLILFLEQDMKKKIHRDRSEGRDKDKQRLTTKIAKGR